MSVSDEAVEARPVNVPNRDRAMISGHRSAAQNGQSSPPMYSTCGLPVAPVRTAPVAGLMRLLAEPCPTVSNSDAGTLVICVISAASVSGDGLARGSGVVYQR